MGNKILTIVAGIVGAIIGFTAVRYIATEVIQPTINPVNYSELETAFVNSCTNSYNSLSGDYNGKTYCECVNNKLKVMYGDKFLTSDDLTNRISKNGYNSTETDKMAECVTQIYEF